MGSQWFDRFSKIILFGVFGVGLILPFVFGRDWSFVREQLPLFIAVGAILVAVVSFLFSYLQQGEEKPRSGDFAEITRLRQRVDNLQNNLYELEKSGAAPLSTSEREAIIRQAIDALPNDITNSARKVWEDNFSKLAMEQAHTNQLRRINEMMNERLKREVFALGRRANVNLVLGILTSLAGLTILAWFVFFTEHNYMNPERVALDLITRLSLVIFIEVFSYFFLRLYRASLYDIKYFQNELTNAEHKIIALEAALSTNSKTLLDKVCETFSKTERNFLLKKNETTLGLRSQELEFRNDKSIADILEKLTRRFEISERSKTSQ